MVTDPYLRDLTKAMGAQTPGRLAQFQKRYLPSTQYVSVVLDLQNTALIIYKLSDLWEYEL